MRRRRIAAWLLLALLLLAGCARPPIRRPVSQPPANPNLAMGNPSHAVADPLARDNYLLEKPYYTLSYNDAKGTPNWVSWRLTQDDLGTAPRVDFYPDDSLPPGFQQVTPTDYTRTGFDRGHMCPHGDRTATEEMSASTFAMTNILPQSPAMNQQAWEQLEEYERSLAREGKTLYIVAGPWGKGGEGRYGPREVIAAHITVPAKCWKVIMVLEPGTGDDVSRVNARTRLIAVIMPNDMSVGQDWTFYRVSVAEVEELTGYTFFDRVPASVIGPLKQKVDAEPIRAAGEE